MSRCPSARATSSTDSSRASMQVAATGCARTDRTTRETATVSIRRSCSSIRTRARSTARSRCIRRYSDNRRTAPRATTATARFSCRRRSCNRTPSPRPRCRPGTPWPRTFVYELHVRGFTKLHPGIPEPLRGTCAGLAHPAALAHLVRLGVTTVELMPVAAAIDDWHLGPLGLTNYWGYNPVALMVPDMRLAPGGIDELAHCVAAFHAAGIEVLLDVVLNHTGEGDARGPTLSLRGLDNATYYRVDAAGGYVDDDTRCGNALALDRGPVMRLALDALRYYAVTTGVDGFRFDLATTLGRTRARLRSRRADARRDRAGSGAARVEARRRAVGCRRPAAIALVPSRPAFANGTTATATSFADSGVATRGMTGELATRIAGSADVFGARRRPPSCSVNFVAAHDGFTLRDLVSFERKHNDANGEDNRDGTDANFSWHHGVEGPAADAAIEEKRRRDVRSLLATLFLSRGTPMLAMGDESGRTQKGNNNAYSQDNATSWLDWAAMDGELCAFVASLIGAAPRPRRASRRSLAARRAGRRDRRSRRGMAASGRQRDDRRGLGASRRPRDRRRPVCARERPRPRRIMSRSRSTPATAQSLSAGPMRETASAGGEPSTRRCRPVCRAATATTDVIARTVGGGASRGGRAESEGPPRRHRTGRARSPGPRRGHRAGMDRCRTGARMSSATTRGAHC